MKNKKFKKTFVISLCVFFILIVSNHSFGIKINDHLPSCLNRSDILYVGGSGPNNYNKIQDAIEEANNGDIIFVFRGIYRENIFINKKIFLFGEDKDSTIIDGGKTSVCYKTQDKWTGEDVVSLFSIDSVHISDFSIRNGEIGILFENSSNNKIEDCSIYSNNIGFRFNNSQFNHLFQCSIFKNSFDGVHLSFSSYNILNKTNIFLNDRGAIFENSFYNTVNRCNISNNNLINIWFSNHSNNNSVFRCNINKGASGICFDSNSTNNLVYHNNFFSNNDQNIDNAYDECENVWDYGNSTGGNHWDDYNGTDENGDGIGDVPYLIDGGQSKDRYPLMDPVVLYDIHDPSVQFSRPVKGLYILGLLVRRFIVRRPLIIGRISLNAKVNDNLFENSSIVEFYINGDLKKIDTTPPYDYTLKRDRARVFGHRYDLKVVALDQSGNQGETFIKVWKFL